MTTIQITGDSRTIDRLEKGQKWLLWSGVFLIVLGCIAILFPMAATITTELFIGWLLIFSGFSTLLTSTYYNTQRPFLGTLVISFLTIALGLFLILYPRVGAIVMVVLVAALLTLDGLVGFVIALAIKPANAWKWFLVSSIVSIFVGVLIGLGLPESSLLILGLLIGINLIISGLSCVMLARSITTPIEASVW